jgi:hypothetical protein
MVRALGKRQAGATSLHRRDFRKPRGERLAFQVLHDEIGDAVVLAHVVQRADVWMIELRDRAGLAIEALAELRIQRERFGEDLDGDRALEPRVARAIHLAHPARAERRADLVWA